MKAWVLKLLQKLFKPEPYVNEINKLIKDYESYALRKRKLKQDINNHPSNHTTYELQLLSNKTEWESKCIKFARNILRSKGYDCNDK